MAKVYKLQNTRSKDDTAQAAKDDHNKAKPEKLELEEVTNNSKYVNRKLEFRICVYLYNRC